MRIARATFCAFALIFVGTPSPALSQIEECAGILQQGLRDSYDLHQASNYSQILDELLSMSDEQLQRADRTNDFGATIPIPIGKAFAQLGLSSGSTRQRLSSIRSAYVARGFSAIDQSDYVWLTQRVVNQAIPDAWIRCIELTVERKPDGISMRVDDDVASAFDLVLSWAQQTARERPPQIQDIHTVGIRRTGINRLPGGLELVNLVEYRQPFERTDSAEARITVFFENASDLTVRLPSLHAETASDNLEGTWLLAGVPPYTEIFACVTTCFGGAGPRFDVFSSGDQSGHLNVSRVDHAFLLGMMRVDMVRVSFFSGGQGSLRLIGRPAPPLTIIEYLTPVRQHEPRTSQDRPRGPAHPQLPVEKTVWFTYTTDESTITVAGDAIHGDQAGAVNYSLLGDAVLMIRHGDEAPPIFFVRPDQLGFRPDFFRGGRPFPERSPQR